MSESQIFFQNLLFDTEMAFKKSPVFHKQQKNGEHWNYSICGTHLQKSRGILLGINWGCSGNHDAQFEIPNGRDIVTYNFIQRSKPFLEKYLLLDFDNINFNYTNLCFFRTPRIEYLTPEDYEISLPLFQQYTEYINPIWIVSLGNSNTNILSKLGQLSDIKEYYVNEGKHKSVKAKLWGYDYYSVPHPNARVKAKSRNELWENIGLIRS